MREENRHERADASPALRLDFKSLFEAAPGRYLVLSPDFHIIAVSDAYLHATMTQREKILGRPLFEVFPDNPDDPSATGTRNLRASLERVLRSGTRDAMAPQKYDIRRPDSEGGGFEERHWSPANSPVLDGRGELSCIIHCADDITDRIRAEEKLRERDERIRFLADAMPQIVWTARPDGGWDYCNSRWYEFTGLSVEETKPSGWKAVIHPDDLPACVARWTRCIETGEDFEGQYRFKRAADGVYRWHLCRGVVRRDERGEVAQWVGTFTDITEARAAREDAERARAAAESADRAKSEFLAHMSHEIRTPLNGVIGMADLLLGTELTEQQRRFAGLAKTSAVSLTTVINDILDFSKIEAGKLEIVAGDFDLHNAVEEVMQILAQAAATRGLEIACHVHPSVPARVRGDADRLRQILINLVNNAIKFTDRGAVVLRVTLDSELDAVPVVRFTISDTGVGIPSDRISRLFKAFSQADASTTRVYGGTGLGLVISKQLAELMGGSIGVESEPGRGSTFWFTAVLEIAKAPAPSVRPREDPRSIRVLAVDDSDMQRGVLHEQIASWGLLAETAPDGEQALKLLTHAAHNATPFRVALIDNDMPGMDGFELAAAIKARSEISGTVLMILLSVDDDIDPERLREMGFAGHLTKPVRQSQLFDAIMDAIAASNHDPSPTLANPVLTDITAQDGTSIGDRVRRVLVAEDNEINQIVVHEILTKSGLHCDIVGNGKDAVNAAQSGQYDLILMDCQMPVMDGFAAAREIRRLERAASVAGASDRRIPIVALTANAMKGDRERCLEAGMDGYASKPIDPKELLSTMSRMLRKGSEMSGRDREHA